jgi:23S rRNA (guanosine2251-2'-O)-methyltransferase
MTVTIYGTHPVLEAIKKRPRSFHRILLAKQGEESHIKHIVTLAEKSNIKIDYDSSKNLYRFARSEHHQGVVAEVEPFPLLDLKTLIARYRSKEKKAFFLVLDSIQDPHNFGSLIRSAVCSGVQAVVFPKDRAVRLTGTVAKSSAGAIEHIPLCRVVNIASALENLKQEGIWIVGTSPGCQKTIYEFDFNLDMAIVIGGEEKGIRPLIRKRCDFCLSVPVEGALDSLNASVAGAVVLFEAMRQRQYSK